MIIPGLVSVTFRGLTVDEVVDAAAAAGLAAIEWGADVHVPPGDDAAADRARTSCAAGGLEVAAYGSYWWAGHDDDADLGPVLRTARRLGAPTVRVWAGRTASAATSADRRAAVTRALRAAAVAAAAEGITVSLEFHGGTLTDTTESTLRLLADVDHPALRTYWQPPLGLADGDALDGLHAIEGALTSVHVFSWWPYDERRPLSDRADLWRAALLGVARLPGDHHALLEFLPGDDPGALTRDAVTLLALAAEAETAAS